MKQNIIVTAPTTLRPTLDQARQLDTLLLTADQFHRTIRHWLRLCGSGRPLPLRTALSRVASGEPLPPVEDDCHLRVPATAVAELAGLRPRDLPGAWQFILPAQVAEAVIRIEAGRVSRRHSGRAAEVAPLLPLTLVPLDDLVRPLGIFHVFIAGVGRVVADNWALPSDITGALLLQAAEDGRQLRADRVGLESRVLAGDLGAMGELYRLSQAMASELDRDLSRTFDRRRPHRTRHAGLSAGTDEGGAAVHRVTWSVRIPASHYPMADTEDTLGIDLGYRTLATVASARGITEVRRRVGLRDVLPTPPDPDDAAQLLTWTRTRAAVLELHRPDIEGLVREALRYRTVHVEDLDWRTIRSRGGATWSPGLMALAGAPLVVSWLAMLAPATGTRVEMVDPAYTSSTCHRCGQPGTRPYPYDVFRCNGCPPQGADANAAQVIRQRRPSR